MHNYKLKLGSGWFYSLVRLCVLGSVQDHELERLEEGKEKLESESATPTTSLYCIKLFACVIGLQLSFLMWGLLQVR